GEESATRVKGRVARVVGGMKAKAEQAQKVGQTELAKGLRHFAKVYKSYEPGLYQCYDVEDMPRTNNDMEQTFGSHRYHERRARGRKVASPGLVVRGAVRLVAGVATRLQEFTAEELAPKRIEDWQHLRAQLDQRRNTRVRQRRFRHDPSLYLYNLEEL